MIKIINGVVQHAQTRRKKRRIHRSGLFDARWYLESYPDVAATGVDPLLHFVLHGDAEGRDPSPNFEGAWYASRWINTETSLSPVEHFLKVGRTRGYPTVDPDLAWLRGKADKLRQSGLFDAAWYRASHVDLVKADIDPLRHYIHFGARELRSPGPNFDATLYAQMYPEYEEHGADPLEHFLDVGRALGHRAYKHRSYDAWRQHYHGGEAAAKAIDEHIAHAGFPPVAVVYVVADETTDVAKIIDALKKQSYQNWTCSLLFVSNDAYSRALSCAETDERITMMLVPDNPDRWSKSLPRHVLLADGDVTLTSHALYLFIERARATNAALIYSDHDSLASGEARPLFKPAFSPELLRRHPYIGACLLIDLSASRFDLFSLVLDRGYKISQAGRAFAADLGSSKVQHVPFVLYQDTSEMATAEIEEQSARDARPTVTIVIPTRDRLHLIEPCISSILDQTTYADTLFDIIVVDNNSEDDAVLAYLAEIGRRSNIRVIRDEQPFNFAALNNKAVGSATGDVIILLNNDTVVNDASWIEKLVYHAMQPDVAAVGCKLLYPDGTVQHGGTYVGILGVACHAMTGTVAYGGYMPGDFTREMSCVTGACLAMRRSVFKEVGGLDPTLAVAFNDVALCLTAGEAGYRNVYVAEPLLIHFESRSRGYDDKPEKLELFRREAIYARRRHGATFQNDPYYSPNLSLQIVDDLAFPPRAPKPWMLTPSRRARPKVLFLSSTHEFGHGVPLVVKQQAEFLAQRGFEVVVGGPKGQREFYYDGCERAYLKTASAAADFASRADVHCVIAETPPFFSIVRYAGSWPKTMFIDHGEPPSELFPDHEARKTVQAEKQFCSVMADRLFAISPAVRAQALEERTEILENGNSHLAVWTSDRQTRRETLRETFGWRDKFVILNVCRFTRTERHYKGVDDYARLKRELLYFRPELAARCVFVLCGKAMREDVDEVEKTGLVLFPNASDAELIDLYCASDAYINLSRWEGYNLGIGQALAMGLPVIASDIPAHRAFPITTSNEILSQLEAIDSLASAGPCDSSVRKPVVQVWEPSLQKLEVAVRELCSR